MTEVSKCLWTYFRDKEIDTVLMGDLCCSAELLRGHVELSWHTLTLTHTPLTHTHTLYLNQGYLCLSNGKKEQGPPAVLTCVLTFSYQKVRYRWNRNVKEQWIKAVPNYTKLHTQTTTCYILKPFFFPSADRERRAVSCERGLPAGMLMVVSFWLHGCLSLAGLWLCYINTVTSLIK